jgi:hypothetical protein
VSDNNGIVEAPQFLVELMINQKGRVIVGAGNVGELIPRGQQDNWLAHQAGIYRSCGDSEDAITEKLKVDALRLDQDPTNPYTDTDFRRIARSISRYEPGAREIKPIFPYTDIGNAERLFAKFGQEIKDLRENSSTPYPAKTGNA